MNQKCSPSFITPCILAVLLLLQTSLAYDAPPPDFDYGSLECEEARSQGACIRAGGCKWSKANATCAPGDGNNMLVVYIIIGIFVAPIFLVCLCIACKKMTTDDEQKGQTIMGQ